MVPKGFVFNAKKMLLCFREAAQNLMPFNQSFGDLATHLAGGTIIGFSAIEVWRRWRFGKCFHCD